MCSSINIGPKLASEVSNQSTNKVETYLENNKLAIPSFRFMFIPVDNVLKTLSLRHLNVSKGAGLDKIPAKMLRIAADIIAPSFPLYF